jgi:hypothetical protein
MARCGALYSLGIARATRELTRRLPVDLGV